MNRIRTLPALAIAFFATLSAVNSGTAFSESNAYLFTVHALKVEKLEVPKSSTPGFVGSNLWANSPGKDSFKVTAGPRK